MNYRLVRKVSNQFVGVRNQKDVVYNIVYWNAYREFLQVCSKL